MAAKLNSFENRWEGDETKKSELEWHKWAHATGKVLDLERKKIKEASVFNFLRAKAGKDYINLENIGKYIYIYIYLNLKHA